ncbi:N-acylneuraminate-9-phosphatase isoform X1 [Homalodisca vitripennis]|uniref:N-acylneuraminate-9-phosphatase isoform X1 n=2 Tax=Homalodisca vitripennis TaxID=197043 RepID=UPI001EEAB6AA|nr:N-acylneuraminate-9-phosphatase isoform X1 [Homalodisca vitripennis]
MAPSTWKCQSAVSTIFFDLDNTLISTRKGDKKTCDKLNSILVEKFNLSPGDANRSTAKFLQSFVSCPHNPEYDIAEWRTILWSEALQEYANIAGEVYSTWLKLRYKYLALSADVISLLKKMRRTFTLALITNGTSSSQWEKIYCLKLRSYFDCILVSGDLPWEKPNKNIFLQACEILRVQPENCVMVGDKLETDILGGKEARLAATVWISGPESPRAFQLQPDFTLASVLELPRLLPLHKPSLPDIDDLNSNSSDGS